jgi:hypothetical protein
LAYPHAAVFAKNKPGRQLVKDVDQLVSLCKREKFRPNTVFKVDLKDETLPLRKITPEVRTRSIAMAPLDYTLAVRKYYHTAVAGLMQVRRDVPPQVGINCYSHEWTDLANSLESMGEYGFDADFKAWDATVPLQFMENLSTIYNRLYADNDPDHSVQDDTIRVNLHNALHCPLLLAGGDIFQAPGGQVSGSPLTSIDNCIVNMMYYYYVWRKVAPNNLKSYPDFHRHVRFYVYGDDNICAVSSLAREFFTPVRFASILTTDLGLTITSARKTAKKLKWQKISELLFLCRGFKREGPNWVAPMVPESLDSILEWQKGPSRIIKDIDDVYYEKESFESLLNSYLQELSLKSRSIYNAGVINLKERLKEANIHCPQFLSFEDMRGRIGVTVYRN